MNDERIIEAVKAGDEAAVGHVITKYSRLIWTIVSRVLGSAASEQDVEECVADVFVYLWQNPEKFDPKRGKLKVWLSVVARSRAIDRSRELSRRGELPLDEMLAADELDIADGIAAEEARERLRAEVGKLNGLEREILVRRYYDGQPPREIARALSMTVKQVNNQLYRTKRKLREMLADGKWEVLG